VIQVSAMTECKFCHKEIDWKKVEGKNVPVNMDGTPHRCKSTATNGTGSTLTGRVTEYEGSNVHIGTHVFFLPPEDRKHYQTYSVGSIVTVTHEKGTCKSMVTAAPMDLEKFLKQEEAQRTQQTIQGTATQETQPMVSTEAHQTPAPAAATALEFPMPTNGELVAMVYNNETYWKAKILLEIQRCEEIRLQVEWKNWQESIALAIQYDEGPALKTLMEGHAVEIHDFIKGKISGT